jgi:hypothetical protein
MPPRSPSDRRSHFCHSLDAAVDGGFVVAGRLNLYHLTYPIEQLRFNRSERGSIQIQPVSF